jgi:hypothetical protein
MKAQYLKTCIPLLVGLLISGVSLSAEDLIIEVNDVGSLTFVAAENGGTEPVTGNTLAYDESGSLTDTAWSNEPDGPSPAADVPLWRNRTSWGGVGTGFPGAYTHGEGNSQILPRLNTRVEVPEGTYDVYVVYGGDNRRVSDPEADNAGGSIDAALAGGELETYDYSNGIYTGITGAEAIWGVFVAKVGTVFNTTEISIDVDAPPMPEEGFYRPLYYGLAYVPAGFEVPGVGSVAFVAAENGGTEPVTGNTLAYDESGSLTDMAWSNEPDGPSPAADVPLWRNRTSWGGVGAGFPGAYTHGEGNSQILPRLNTRVEVPEGTYDVYVVYGGDNRRVSDPEADNAGGSIDASLAGGELETYDYSNGIYTGITGAEAIWGVFVAKVGTVFNTTEISIDVDAPPLPEEGFYRPLYYGLAYVPAGSDEPPFVQLVQGEAAGNGWVSPWFGSFELFDDGWINHGEFGWLFVDFVSATDNMWMWSLTLESWLWTNEANFPVVYEVANDRWVYFFQLPGEGIFLYDYSTLTWVTINP